MTWIILSIVLFIFCILQMIIIRQKVKQVNGYDEILAQYETWLVSFADTVEKIDKELDIIDDAGTFRSDDEIGYFYQSMYTLLKELSKYGYTDKPEKAKSSINNTEEYRLFGHRDKLVVNNKNKRKQDDIELDDIKTGISNVQK